AGQVWFPVITQFHTETYRICRGITVHVLTVTHGRGEIVIEAGVAQGAVEEDIVGKLRRGIDHRRLAILINLTGTIADITLRKTCRATHDPLRVVTVNLRIQTNHNPAYVLIVADNAIVSVKVAAEVAHPRPAVIGQTVTAVSQTGSNGILLQIPDIGIR